LHLQAGSSSPGDRQRRRFTVAASVADLNDKLNAREVNSRLSLEPVRLKGDHVKKLLPLLICLGTCLKLEAEPLVFHATTGTDREGVASAVAELAREALAQQPNASPDEYLSTRYSLQLAAGQYAEAATTFSKWRELHPARPGFDNIVLSELYSKAKAMEATEHVPYEQAFKKTFADLFGALDDATALDDEYFLQTPVFVFQGQLERTLAQHKDKVAIAFPDALNLIQAYLTTTAQQSIMPYLSAAIAADDGHRYLIQQDVLIRTAEGATLSAIVVRRTGVAVRQPASLFFNIYTDVDASLYEAKRAATYGYVGVSADTRGKRLSHDEIAPWEHEVQDTYGVIDWISKQPWSDGQVGMQGSSYAGFAQWAAAKSLHPALKTIVPAVTSFPGYGLPMQNNVFQYVNYAWPFYVMNNRYLDEATYYDRRWNTLNQKWFASGRPYREIDAIDGTPNRLQQKQLLHPSFDSYYQAMQPYKEDYARINIPVLSLTGYYDSANAAAVNYLIDHYRHNRNANHYLVIGPYDHISTKSAFKPPVVQGYTIDPVAQINTVELTYQWFDYVMRGGPKPALLEDRINYEVMGANLWRHAPSIEQMSTETLTLYLSNVKVGERYRLSPSRFHPDRFLEQTVDFADRMTQNNLYPRGAIVDAAVAGDALAFVSAPFETAVSVEGLISGQLDVAINKKDFDFSLAAYELMPDGKLFWLSYYLGRASYADDMSVRKLLIPGKRTPLPFARTPLVCRQLSRGSRLLLLVTVNKNAFAQVNYGTGKDVSDESVADAQEPLEVRWYTDSFVRVPIRR
jgi:putative CocE/NonD family hydrolase